MILRETERLRLRNVKKKDAEIMFEYRNHEQCAKYQREQTKDKVGIENLILEREKDDFSLEKATFWAIAWRDTDEMVGEVVIMPKKDTISLGYTISYCYHRQGIAYEILSDLIFFLHEKYPEKELICLVDPKNIASRGLLKKLGYEDMGYVPEVDSQMYGKFVK